MAENRLQELYGEKVEERKKPLELSFGTIDMMVPGAIPFENWAIENAGKYEKVINNEQIHVACAIILKGFAKDESIREMPEVEIAEWVHKNFTREDEVITMFWLSEVGGAMKALSVNFQNPGQKN
jgi:hypothetical protein